MGTSVQDRLLLISSFWLSVGWAIIIILILVIAPELIVPTFGAGAARLFVLMLFIQGSFLIYRGIVLVSIAQKFPDVYQKLRSEGREFLALSVRGPYLYRSPWSYTSQIIGSFGGGVGCIILALYGLSEIGQ